MKCVEGYRYELLYLSIFLTTEKIKGEWRQKHARSATGSILSGHLLHTIFNTLWLSSQRSTSVLHTVRYTLNAILFKAGHYGQKHCFIMHRSILIFFLFCFHNMWKELEIIINMLLSIYCITMYLHIQIMFNFLKIKKSIFSCTEPEMSTSAALTLD